MTSLTPIWRIASAMFWPCETRTSTCRNFATISSGVYRFFGIAVLLHVKRHSSGRTTSPLQRGRITCPWPGRFGLFALEAYDGRVAGAYFAAATSCEPTFYEVAPYRPNARGAAEFRLRVAS